MSAILQDFISGARKLLLGAVGLALVVGVVWFAAEVALLVRHLRTVAPFLVGTPSFGPDGAVAASYGVGIVGSRDGGRTWTVWLGPQAQQPGPAPAPAPSTATARP